ncbi:MAG: hypothetical protein K0R57_1068 [Paenibacillaceae bacterium]|jgi:CRISPR-associated protein Cmr3|nr:hypothetical protein [Paenibacillaceae bacterium]
MTFRYLVTFKPLTPYFFGGMHSFGYGERVNYLVKSVRYPQQTTLLGVIRRILIEQALPALRADRRYSEDEKKTINHLIGNNGFTFISEPAEPASYGIIKSISPLWLVKEGQEARLWVPKPLDYEYQIKELATAHSMEKQNILLFDKFNPKEGCRSGWITPDKTMLLEDSLIGCTTQVGIRRLNSRKNESGENVADQDYYKQEFCVMKDPSLAFACWMHLSEPYAWNNQGVVPIGGERTPYSYHIHDSQASTMDPDDYSWSEHKDLLSAASSISRIVLLSDTYLPSQDLHKYAQQSIVSLVPFRYLQSSDTGKNKRTDKLFQLLQRGSVLYTKDPTSLINKIKSYGVLHNIGFNHCHLIRERGH